VEHCSILHALYVSSSFKTKYLQEHYFSILLESRSIKYTFRFNFIILTFNIGVSFTGHERSVLLYAGPCVLDATLRFIIVAYGDDHYK